MQLDLSGHHVEVTQAMRSYVEKRFERITRHFEQVIDVHCVLTVEKLRHKAEATLMLRGNKIYADATEPNMYAAIDALADKLPRDANPDLLHFLQKKSYQKARMLLEGAAAHAPRGACPR